MDGIDVSWKRIQGGAAIEEKIKSLTEQFSFVNPSASVPALVNIYKSIKALSESNWRKQKLSEVQDLIESCSGLFSEATTSQQNVAQGDTLKVNLFLNNRFNANTKISLRQIKVEGWDTSVNIPLGLNKNFTLNHAIPVAENRKLSQPYWLEYPIDGGSFDVRDQRLIGKAENDAAFTVNYQVNIEGELFNINRPIQFKIVDPAKGELYEPVAVLPKMELNYTKDNYVAINGAPVKADIHFKSNVKDSVLYKIKQQYSDNWMYSDKLIKYGTFNNTENTWSGIFTPKSKQTNTTEVSSLYANEGTYNGFTKTIAYDHIPTITYFPKAKANLVNVDCKIIGKKIGYIIGAGDKVPDALTNMGYDIKFLTEADITETNLKQYDAIITGIRAYNLLEWLTIKNEVLMNYVKNGGNLIVQYAKSNLVGTKNIKIGPYPFIVNSLSRVTEEDAAVHFLLPNNPLLNYPNKITDKDFEGWTQERSTYQAEQIDAHYESILGMKDSGDKLEGNGSLITTTYGKGRFTYVSLVLFRQLPAGVPGAYRLMANLIAH